FDFATVITKERHRQQLALAGLFHRHDDVARAAAGRNSDSDVFRASLCDELAQKNDFHTYVIRDGADICRLKRKRHSGNWSKAFWGHDAIEHPVIGMGGGTAVAKDNHLAAALQLPMNCCDSLANLLCLLV